MAPGLPRRSISQRIQQHQQVVLRLALTLFDTDGNEGKIDLYPWAVSVPHEEVKFATASNERRNAAQCSRSMACRILSPRRAARVPHAPSQTASFHASA